MAVRNRNRVRIDTRLDVLATTVGKYAKAFGADEDCLESIKRGIHQRQIIERIELHYFSGEKYVGRITMEINWKQHQILVASDGGNEFQLDSNKSILEQLDAASKEIIRHVDRLRSQCKVTKIISHYRYRREYRDNPQKHKEAQDFLGHTSAKNTEIPSTEEFKICIRFVMDRLKELEITIEN